MLTATIENTKPLTADLEFDLGDVLKCASWNGYGSCPREAAWAYSHKCGCVQDEPLCDGCRRTLIAWIRSGEPETECRYCRAKVRTAELIWRRL